MKVYKDTLRGHRDHKILKHERSVRCDRSGHVNPEHGYTDLRYSQVTIAVAKDYFREGRYEDALYLLLPTIKKVKDRNNRSFLLCMAGNAYAALGQFEEAAAFLFRAVDDWQGNAHAWSTLIDVGTRMRDEHTVEIYKEARELFPKDGVICGNGAMMYLVLGDNEQALAAAQEAVRLDSYNPISYGHLCRAYLANGNKQGALAAAQEGVNLDPRRAISYGLLCQAYLANGNKKEALAVAQEGVRLDPHNSIAYGQLCQAHLANGNKQEALTAAQESVKINPRSAIAYGQLCQAHLANGNKKEMLAAVQEAVKLDPRSAISYGQLCQAHLANGNRQEALAAAQEAVKLDPRSAISYAQLSQAYLANDNKKEALAAAQKGVKLEPDSPIAYLVLLKTALACHDFEVAQSTHRTIQENKALQSKGAEFLGAWFDISCGEVGKGIDTLYRMLANETNEDKTALVALKKLTEHGLGDPQRYRDFFYLLKQAGVQGLDEFVLGEINEEPENMGHFVSRYFMKQMLQSGEDMPIAPIVRNTAFTTDYIPRPIDGNALQGMVYPYKIGFGSER